MASNGSREGPGKLISGLVLLVALAAGTIFCTIMGVKKFGEDKDLKLLGGTASAPFMRIYVDSPSAIPAMKVTLESGTSRKSSASSSLDWVHVVFDISRKSARNGQHSQVATFKLKLALLCVPEATRIYPGADLVDASVGKALKRHGCPETSAYEKIVTGKYDAMHSRNGGPSPAPLRDLADDATGIANISFPRSPKPMITNSSDSYIATFPHVTSLSACTFGNEPQPTGGTESDGGPEFSSQETSPPVCGAVTSLNVTKELDLPPKVADADSQQEPSATDLKIINTRYALTWDDPTGNISLVVATSPQETANSHVNEVYGAVYWGIAAAAGISFLVELVHMIGDRSKHVSGDASSHPTA